MPRCTDVDGHTYVDFCLGDTGAMTGHGLPQVADAVARQARRGVTTMLPTADALWVAEELHRRFGLPFWQMAMTATDANRFVLRFAREITGRPKVLVFDWCYHGTVDEALATLDADGRVIARPGSIGPQVDPALTTAVVPFNDVGALEMALAEGDVACVLAEPALTNIGIVLPEPGYHEALRRLTARDGHAPRHRRDAHDLRRPRRLHPGVGARARRRRGRQDDRWRCSRRGLRPLGRRGRTPPRPALRRRCRCERRRRHPDRQRAGVGGGEGHAVEHADRRRVRPDHPAGRSVDRRRAGRHRCPRPRLDRPTAGLPGRVLVLPGAP